MDWWLHAAWSIILEKCNDKDNCYYLFVTEGKIQVMVVLILSILWTITVLTLQDAMLLKVKLNLTYDACMELRNALINNAQQLFPFDLVTKAVEKSSCALQNA